MGRSQSRRTTPSRKGQQRQERDAMLRLLMHAVDKAGGTLAITAADQLAMPADAELRSTTDPITGAQVLTVFKPEPKAIEVRYVEGGGPHDADELPPGLQELLSSMDPRAMDERAPYHRSATTDALQAELGGNAPIVNDSGPLDASAIPTEWNGLPMNQDWC